ncbi:hypothetical protein [Hymenobacter norwichensis]|uniref:hypothetical protein n=1 Tax=Hymenobacter norwichensis TaxID=223903 RepID=UPI0003B61788|nr:hypothetical protein [Hymenobacter norwichensis]
MATSPSTFWRVRAVLLALLLWAPATLAWACRVCRPRVQATIHAPNYTQNLLLVLLPVGLLLLLLGVGLFFASSFTRRFTSTSPAHG